MLVVDANVVVEVTLERFGAKALDMLGDEQLVAPWLLWSEMPAALSAMVFRTEISRELGESALGRLETINVEPRHPDGLIAAAWRITKERGWAKTYDAVTLCVAQAIMGIPSDYRFVAVAGKRLRHLFPVIPTRDALHKRRLRRCPEIEALIMHFARQSPGFFDDLLLVDSTPVECARSKETGKRGGASSLAEALTDAADYGYCASHSRYFFGFRLHALFAPDGTPRALALTSPKIDEKLVCLQLVARRERVPGQALILIGDKNFRGKDFETELAALNATIIRPRRKDEPGHRPHLAPLRQRIESIFWTCKDILTLERHGARTLRNLRVRLCTRFAALAAAITLNHQLSRPSRSLARYTT